MKHGNIAQSASISLAAATAATAATCVVTCTSCTTPSSGLTLTSL